ncbi:helix-turn-helix transcriptional regulator [Actinokineospora inagensis]|uniref:helix-turn-helix transcriptional regulator n=1 Tax=Actinokineospora inagensis TaxID=103730 RepID=UPI00041FC59F|nr:LuxR family transcriptional regulator [Actinokineospora inagensis]
MTLVERRTAVDALVGWLAECALGGCRVVAVVGGPATGKSSLLDLFADRAAGSGALLLSATGARGERRIPLGAVRQLASGLPDDLVARPRGLAGSRPAHDVPGCVAETAKYVQYEAVAAPCQERRGQADTQPTPWVEPLGGDFVDLVLAAARERSVVVAIDDIQHVDTASLDRLTELRERAAAVPLLVVVTDWEPLSTELTTTADHRLRLGLLTERGVADLLRAETGSNPDTADAAEYHRVTGGNPLLLHALIADNRGGGAVRPGFAFRQAVLACLHRWDPRLLDLARALAVLGNSSAPGALAEMIGSSEAVAARLTGVLCSAGVLAGWRFRHAAVRAAVLDGLSPNESGRLHLRAADVLHRRRARPVEVARELVAAGRVGGDWGITALRSAALDAIATDRGEFAVRCLELALPGTSGRVRADTAADLAGAVWRYQPAEFGYLSDVDAVTATRFTLWQQAPEPSAVDFGLGLADEWIRGGRSPVRASRSWEHAAAALTAGLTRGAASEVVVDAERVLHGCPLADRTLEVLAAAITALLLVDRVDLAERWCRELLREAEARRATTWQALLGAVSADVELRQGAIGAARATAEHSLRLLPARSWGVLIGLPLATMITADTAAGVVDSPALREVVPDEMAETVVGARYLRARGHHYLGSDRVLAAIADFQACGRFLTQVGVDLPGLVPWRTDLAEAHLRLGRVRAAVQLARAQSELPAGSARHTRARSVRVLALAGHQPVRLLQEVAESFRATGDRFSAAVTLAELAAVLANRGEGTRARRVAKTASDEAAACGVSGLLDRVPVRSGPAAGQSPPTLSDAEHRVATLAALGHTNREIAHKLYITISTVEQHLTKIYRKLGVSRRSDLPAGLAVHSGGMVG